MGAATALGPHDDSSDPADEHLGSVMSKIDERAGYAGYEDQEKGSCEITDHDPAPDSIDPVGDQLCSEIAFRTRIARLVCPWRHEALPRVSDAVDAQRIEAAIGLLDQALSRTLHLKAWSSNPEQAMR
jgi:hypothetical protein